MRKLIRSATATAGAVALALTLSAAVSRAASGTSAVRASRPGSSYAGSLAGVTTISSSDAWAVGVNDANLSGALLMNWNGTAWRKIAAPASKDSDALAAVAASGARDVWAVGTATPTGSSAVQRTLILHWTGQRWSAVPSPSPGKAGNYLDAVTAVSHSDAWAVGNYCPTSSSCGGSALLGRPLTLHWNGRRWSLVQLPAFCVGGVMLTSVSAVSGTNAWATGECGTKRGTIGVILLRWNGRRWSRAPAPALSGENLLTGVSETSARNAWAVGVHGVPSLTYGSREYTLILRWNGRRWLRVASPNPGTSGNLLDSVSATSVSSAWATGWGSNTRQSGTVTVLLHWNGHRWSSIPSPAPGPNTVNFYLYAISARSPRLAWAVGQQGPVPATTTWIMRWNGTSWSRA